MRTPLQHWQQNLWQSLRCVIAVLGLVVALQGCQTNEPATRINPQVWDEWSVGQVLDAKTGRLVSTAEWLEGLARYDVIYLGEEHHNRSHIEAALTVLRSLVARGRRPVLAMEMFGWEGQPALDDYLKTKESARPEFLERAGWKQNWGGAFEDYEPLAQFAKDQRLPVLAMNPPKALIRQVVKLGLAQAKEQPEWRQWGMEQEAIVDDPAYRSRILSQLQACHGGGAPEDYQTMYEASMVRDEGMAKTVTAAVYRVRTAADPAQGPVVSYTGGGHVQYRLPVPNRVARRVENGLKQVTIYMATFEQERAAELYQSMQEGIADFVWLTPPGSQGAPRRCR
ncbi:MAG: ChaN family lipoprotein [Nitrospira sp.]|nr:ChaN family lipoprotein [Nitrospira sp.]